MSKRHDEELQAAEMTRTASRRLNLALDVRVSTAKSLHTILWLFAEGRHVGTIPILKQGSLTTFRACKILKSYATAMSTPATLDDAIRFAGTDVSGKAFKEAA